MERNIDLKDISDGKLYGSNDMVKADCQGCQGCSYCCHSMVSTIILDPYDIFQLQKELKLTVNELLLDKLELNVVDGMILPNLRQQEATGACPFLDGNGRCSIHGARPGFCRLFPLGRVYEDRSFQYFLQTKECIHTNRTKVKVKKWIGISDISKYETFISKWHYFLKDVAALTSHETEEDLAYAKQLNMLVLQVFYMTPYNVELDFYQQFETRYEALASQLLK